MGKKSNENPSPPLDAVLLRPFAAAYAAISHRRVLRFRRNLVSLPVPVVSIGNITFGGTSKTPLVQFLVKHALRKGSRPGVSFRGWKGRIDIEKRPPTLAGFPGEKMLGWQEIGDEPALVARAFAREKVPVAVGRDRLAGSRLLIEKGKSDIIFLDDCYQYASVGRDADIVLIDTLSPFGRTDGYVGFMREPVSALDRANAIILTRTEASGAGRLKKILDMLDSSLSSVPPVFRARTAVGKIRDIGTGEEVNAGDIRSRNVLAFAGIGNPRGFVLTLESLGLVVSASRFFPDHHPYKLREIDEIEHAALEAQAEFMVTTSKDAIRLEGIARDSRLPLLVVEVGIEIEEEERFLTLLDGLCGR